MIKPCVKCGSLERYKNGSCARCAAEYRKENAEKRAAYQRDYVKNHPDWKKTYDKQYAEKNKEKIAAYKLDWEQKNREKVNANQRKWRKENPEGAYLISKRWRENNPEAKALIAHNRRTLIKGDRPTTDIVRKLWIKQCGMCACCGESLLKGFQLDHIMPLALGGRHIDENLQLLTSFCNRSKGKKHPDIWKAEKGIA